MAEALDDDPNQDEYLDDELDDDLDNLWDDEDLESEKGEEADWPPTSDAEPS